MEDLWRQFQQELKQVGSIKVYLDLWTKALVYSLGWKAQRLHQMEMNLSFFASTISSGHFCGSYKKIPKLQCAPQSFTF